MRRLSTLLVFAVVSSALVAAPVSAQSCTTMAGNLVANCSFENPGPSSFPNVDMLDALPGWSVGGGAFERWSNGFSGFTSKDGVAHLELDSNWGNTSIWQVITTVVGQAYTVNFSAAHRPDGQFSQIQFLVGPQSDGNIVFTTPQMTAGYQWMDYEASFVATGTSTEIVFRSKGTSNSYGDHIDNISVTAVPEPTSLVLVGLGLLGVAVRARRRFA